MGALRFPTGCLKGKRRGKDRYVGIGGKRDIHHYCPPQEGNNDECPFSGLAAQQRGAYGLNDAASVPRLPGRMNQRRP